MRVAISLCKDIGGAKFITRLLTDVLGLAKLEFGANNHNKTAIFQALAADWRTRQHLFTGTLSVTNLYLNRRMQ